VTIPTLAAIAGYGMSLYTNAESLSASSRLNSIFLNELDSIIVTSLSAGSAAILLSGGEFRLANTDVISDASSVVVYDAAVLNLNGFNETIGSLEGSGTVALGSGSLTTGGNNNSTTFSGVISGDGGLTKEGASQFILWGVNTYAGPTRINGGALFLNGSLSAASAVTVNSGGALAGWGTVYGPVTVAPEGIIDPGGPGPGILSTGSVNFSAGSQFIVELNGTVPGTQYDQLRVTGTVSLGSSTLVVTVGFATKNGDGFVIIDNDGKKDNVVGTFAGYAEGSRIPISGDVSLQITYQGGDGNDVRLSSRVSKRTAVSTMQAGGTQALATPSRLTDARAKALDAVMARWSSSAIVRTSPGRPSGEPPSQEPSQGRQTGQLINNPGTRYRRHFLSLE
jgi:autotransporter-associated beta strand protein